MNPLFYNWDGECFKPIPRQAKEADKRFVIGEVYSLDEIQDRSPNSHRHYFATIKDAWVNLSEAAAIEFPTPEHLRKFALIRCGFYDKRSIATSSKTEALRVAAFIKPMDDYAIVTTSNSLVEVFTAKSQNHRSMNRKEFAESKIKVLEYVASLIGVTQKELENNSSEPKERIGQRDD